MEIPDNPLAIPPDPNNLEKLGEGFLTDGTPDALVVVGGNPIGQTLHVDELTIAGTIARIDQQVGPFLLDPILAPLHTNITFCLRLLYLGQLVADVEQVFLVLAWQGRVVLDLRHAHVFDYVV